MYACMRELAHTWRVSRTGTRASRATLSFCMRGPRGKLTDDGSKGTRHSRRNITSPRAMLIRSEGYELYGTNRSNWCDCAGREINRLVTRIKNIDAQDLFK